MKRGLLVTVLVALVITGALVLLGGGPSVPSNEPDDSSSISAERKAKIRDFWSVYRQARSLRLAGRWQQAVASYQRALELDPRHEDSLYGLANCYLETDVFRKALRCLDRLVEINPMSLRGQLQKGMIHACPTGSEFDLDAAEAAFGRAFEMNQEDTGSLLRLGEVALMRGNDERALELFTLANRSNFRAVEGYYFRAYIRWKQNRLAESRSLLRAAMRHGRKPKVVAGVPGEGDTRPGSSLPPTTLDDKLPLRRFWSGLVKHHPSDEIETSVLSAEFSPVKIYLTDLRVRMVATSR